MFIQSESKKRLNLDVIGQLEDDLEANPLDYTKWNRLIQQVLNKDKEEQVRTVFGKYLSIFKTDGKQWGNYINYELNRGEFKKVESLFAQCFPLFDDVEICRLYVAYVRRVNDVITGGEKARGIVIQAFEFAVNKVGIDIQSGELWNDYLEFLKSWTPVASWEQQQKIDIIRKVYKKFLVNPTISIENSWTQYTKWENEINPATASKFTSERSAEFMLARSWNTEWQNITKNQLNRDIIPYSLNGEKSEIVKSQMKYWLKWIEFEKKNTLEIKDDNLLDKRITYVFKQCVSTLPFVSELWFKFSKYWLLQNEDANINKCIELLIDGLNLNPKSLLLTFQLAELYEKDNSFDKGKECYLNLATVLQNDHIKVTEQIDTIKQNVFSSNDKSINNNNHNNNNHTTTNNNNNTNNISTNTNTNNNNNSNKNNSNENMDEDDEDSEMEMPNKQVYQLTKDERKEVSRLEKIQNNLAKSITLIYIKLMTAYKRAEDIKATRPIFKLARKNFPEIGWELYFESASLEHYSGNTKSALRILDTALKKPKFAIDGNFLLAYLNHLIKVNDVDNIRKLIQTCDSNLSKEITSLNESMNSTDVDEDGKQAIEKEIRIKKESLKRLFKAYISYASSYRDIDVTSSFANKYEQMFSEDDPIDLFTDRYRIDGINAIKEFEFGECEFDSDEEEEDDRPRRKRRRKTKTTETEVVNAVEPTQFVPTNNISNDSNGSQEPSFVGPTIVALLNALPNASYFGPASESVFKNEKLVQLFANLANVPIE